MNAVARARGVRGRRSERPGPAQNRMIVYNTVGPLLLFHSARLGTDRDSLPARHWRAERSFHERSCVEVHEVGTCPRGQRATQTRRSARVQLTGTGGTWSHNIGEDSADGWRTRLQIFDRLLAHHFRRSDRHEAALQAQHAPRAKSNRNEALHRDLREHRTKRRVRTLGRVASGAAARDVLTANGE